MSIDQDTEMIPVRLDFDEQSQSFQLGDDRLARGEPVAAVQSAHEGGIGDAIHRH